MRPKNPDIPGKTGRFGPRSGHTSHRPGGVDGRTEAAVAAAVTAALRSVHDAAGIDAHRAATPSVRRSRGVFVKGLPEPQELEQDRSEWAVLIERNRAALWPWIIAAGVFGIGLVGWFTGWVYGRPAFIAAAVCTVLALLLGGVGLVRRAAIGRLLPAGWRPWLVVAVADRLAWTGLFITAGLSWLIFAWWLGSTVAFGLRYWAHLRLGWPSGPKPAEPQRDIAAEAAELIENFQTRLACKGGIVEGARIERVRPYEYGIQGLIELVGGRQSIEALQAAKPRVCTALGYFDPEIILEHLPQYGENTAEDDGQDQHAAADKTDSNSAAARRPSPSQVRIRVVTRSPIRGGVYFKNPQYADGKILIGPYADGIGNALVTLYTEDSMETGFVMGSRGSGKSRLLEIIGLTAVMCSPTVLIYIDGQNGASSPLLWKHALWRGGPDELQHIIAGLAAIQQQRQAYNRYRGWTGFTPTPEYPGILVIVDECHRIFTEDTKEFFENLSREGRKLGIGLFAATQAATIAAAFANSDVLRSNLVAGNGIALRTMSRVQQNVFPGLPFDLTALPKLPGYGYTVDEGDTGQVRTAPFRAQNLIGDDKAAGKELPEDVYTAEAWFAALPEQRLDDISATAAGTHFSGRHARAQAEHDALAAIFEDGQRPPAAAPVEPATPEPVRRPAQVVRFPTLASIRAELERAAEAAISDGEEAAEAAADAAAAAWEHPQTPIPDGLGQAQMAAFRTVLDGANTPSLIAERLAAAGAKNVTRQAVHNALTKLVAAGHLNTDRGRYFIADLASTR